MFIFLSHQALSQKEGNNWYFGKHAGISFQNGSPVSFTHNAIANQIEGVSAISDTAGNILFYTDGMDVYNKNNQIMANGQGLQGHISASQSALIVRKPGSLSHYYILPCLTPEEPLTEDPGWQFLRWICAQKMDWEKWL